MSQLSRFKNFFVRWAKKTYADPMQVKSDLVEFRDTLTEYEPYLPSGLKKIVAKNKPYLNSIIDALDKVDDVKAVL